MTANTKVTDEEKNRLEEKVKTLLRAVELDVDLETDTEEDRLYFNVSGPDVRFFLRNKEEVLRSVTLLLQTLHHKLFPESEIDIRFDANRVLREREDEVRAMVREAVNALSEDGDETLLEPLNPYERRIIHLALKNEAQFETESVGEGHYKKVKVRFVSGSAAS